MSKKSFDESALDNIIGGMTSPVIPTTEDSITPPVPQQGAPSSPNKVGRKRKGVCHLTVSLPENTASRLRALSGKTGQPISSIVDYLLTKAIDNYENTYGKLVIKQPKKKELSEFLG